MVTAYVVSCAKPEVRAATGPPAAGRGAGGAGGCAETLRPASGCSVAAQRAAVRCTSGSGRLPDATAISW